MNGIEIRETGIDGAVLLLPKVFRDARGYFVETYNEARYAAAGICATFVQDNESMSSKGVVRGLHWQAAPFTQAKLVRVIKGSVWDVAVDIRKGSPTYGKHVSVVLSAENGLQFFIPRGFAHGFVVLEDETIFSYKCDNPYSPAHERGMRFDDPALGIEWPDIGVAPTLSEKDTRHPPLSGIEPWEEMA